MMQRAHANSVAHRGAMRGLWSALDAAGTPASTLAILAALARALSPQEYGILVMAFAASGLSMAVNPAIAATTTKFVSEVSAQRETGGRTVAHVLTVSLITVGVIDLLMLLAVAMFNERLTRCVFGAETLRIRPLGQVLFLAVLAVGLQQLEAVLAAGIRGLERFRRQALIEICSRTALVAVVTYAAWRTRSLETILIAQCAIYAVSLMVRAAALRQVMPHRKLFQLSGPKDAGTMLRYGGWMWLSALAGVCYTSVDRIIIGRSFGAAAAGQYNIYVQITQLTHFIPSSVFAFSLPVFSRLAAQGRVARSELALAYKTYLVAIGVAALVVAAAMMLCWPLLFRLIAGAGFSADRIGAASLLTLNFLLLAFNVAPYYLLLALGRPKVVSVITTVSMLGALVLMLILIPRFGLQGAALARLAYGVGALLLLKTAHRTLKEL